ncbi:MAG: hypothetical protein AB7F59_00600 [Bdellovibrionales bacterium]
MSCRSLLRILGCFLALSISHQVWAQTNVNLNNSIRHDYISPRALGMGDAFTAVADDHNTLFYNPAGLAFLQEGNLNLKLQAGATPEVMNFTRDLQSATGKPTETEKVNATTDLITQNFGKDYWARPSVGGIWVRPLWGVAFIPLDTSIDLAIHQQTGPTLNVEVYQDSTLAYGTARTFMDKKLAVGVTAKAIYRGYVGKAVQATELVVNSEYFSKKDAKEGMTIDADVGALYRSPFFTDKVKPTFSAVLRNVADYGFKRNFHLIDANSEEPPKLDRRLDLGSNWEFGNWWIFAPRVTLDVRDIGHRFWTFRKGLHVGVELDWLISWWLKGGYRMGLSQGYLTAGASAQFSWFRLDLATFSEELGTSNAKKENRRWILSASLDF